MLLIFTLLLVQQSTAVIYRVNDTEYYKMPPLFAMDDYTKCLLSPGDTYCLGVYDLHSKEDSDLMNFIQEFSAYKIKHFNHTHIYRATCVTSTCKHYINDTLETTPDLEDLLEGCVNETIWRDYRLEAKLTKLDYCKKYNDITTLDLSDYIVFIVYTVIIVCNVIGSFYDVTFCENDKTDERPSLPSSAYLPNRNPYLLAFSLKRNWGKLISPGGSGPDPRLTRLKLFNSLRTLTMVCVIFSHVALVMSFTYIANPEYVEKSYDDPLKQILFNGSLVTHTFFVMSAFLLAYNLQITAEKQKISWLLIPKGILLRWLRLTPTYALILATISTWMRHVGTGPLWHLLVSNESNICRQYWWANIFYFNNYMYREDICFPQSWYLAADTQLFCFSLILFVVIQKPKYRKVALALLFLASLVITAGHTYFLDLDAVVIQSPESYRNLYTSDDTFTLVYVRGHTNLSTYTMGLAGGLLTYEWQTNEKDLSRYKKYRWASWLAFPCGVAVILSGGIFYIDGYTPSTLIRVVYATVYKPIFQALTVFLIISTIFKFENVYRSILEWRGFTWTGRVSYCAFLLHTMFQRSFIGNLTSPLILSDYYVLIVLIASTMLSFACGAVLWLCVEAPLGGLTRALLSPKKDK